MKTATGMLAEACTIDDPCAALSGGRLVYALEKGERGHYHLVREDAWNSDRHTLGSQFPTEPLKSLLFQPREFFVPILDAANFKRKPNASAARLSAVCHNYER